jgi:glycerophosphoryl diester phosphodiesterase
LPDLPAAFLRAPIAHRGLHDRTRGVIENSRAAVAAAAEAGYGIEIDVQRAGCGEAMVFHDARCGA